ncbi:Aar2 [Symbiodinium natans]|uniref:Aar2 protein n=1 Tax=Symbiodinium natans TaxID=878477 RepID=A0A812GXZ4_9DINO|nr:Aar2 [Symbiodinium natans]
MLFGLDYAAWSVGPRFMGVKLVPPGLHYLYCSASAAEDVGLARSGFFLHLRPKDVAVFRWDPEGEELTRPSPDEELRYADGARSFDFDRNLGPYPLELREPWAELTRHATAELAARIEPVSGRVRSKRAEYDAPPQSAENEEQDGDEVMADARKGATIESNSSLFFSSVPRVRKGRTAAEITQLHMDRTVQLEEMLEREYSGNELAMLGELQLAYIAFLLGQNADGFDQWRALLQLLCSCEEAAHRRSELYAELLRAFFAQLSQAPADLFGDDLTKDNFLGSCTLSLLEICEEGPAKLRKRCAKLRQLVEEKFGLSTQDLALLGEDAPEIVEAGAAPASLPSPVFTDMD